MFKISINEQDCYVINVDERLTYINHSCSPNVILIKNIEFVSLKEIGPEEEILIDYATVLLDPDWKMTCNCQSPDCRKEITGFQFMPENFKMKYKAHLPEAFYSTKEQSLTPEINEYAYTITI
jgi:SET domain-containing protein